MKPLWMAGCIICMLFASSTSYGEDHREKDFETAMTLGAFQYETGDNANAVISYQKALTIKPSDTSALLSLGKVYSRTGDFDNARTTLLRALEVDKTDRRILYELGVVSYKLKAGEEAKAYFSQITTVGVEDELTAAAKRYLDLLTAREEGPFSLKILAGLQHDSNVILEPSSPVATGAKKADWRAVASINAAYAFVRQERSIAEAGYSFYQSIHNDITEFNVQQHSLNVGGRYTFADNAQGGLVYRYNYTLVGGDHYSDVHQVAPTLTFTLSPTQSANLSYTFEDRKFSDSADFPQNSDRDGTNNAVAVSYSITILNSLAATAGLAYDKDSTSAAWWSAAGRKVSAGMSGEAAGIKGSLGLSFYDKDYSSIAPGYTDTRHDRVQELTINLMKDLSKRVSIDLSELYTRNRSNEGPFDYTRNIVGLFAVMTL